LARSGLPVINLPGCPSHYDTVVGALTALVSGRPLPLDDYNAPLQW
jgi:Ni,Fe-hydrogenase I small subunit